MFDIQRVGPSTGLPDAHGAGRLAVRRAQLARRHAARAAAARLGRRVLRDGDGRRSICPNACRAIIFVMSDLDLGMNTWMSQPFKYPEKPLDRGKVLDEAKLRELGASWGRYKDVDGDGIPWRTVPGTNTPAFFTRGSGHNDMALYTEKPDDYVRNVDRLARKFDTARTLVPAPEIACSIPKPRSASSRSARATGRSRSRAISCARKPGLRHVVSPPARVSVHAGRRRLHPPSRPHLHRRAESRRADAAACCSWTAKRRTRRA